MSRPKAGIPEHLLDSYADEKDPKTVGNTDRLWWTCPQGHRYDMHLRHRKTGSGCPFCAGKRVLKGFNDLATTHPHLHSEWNDSAELLEVVTAASNKRAKWKCKSGHEWEAVVNSRKKGNGCPYCAGHRPVAGKTDLPTLSPELMKEYADTIDPTTLTKSSTASVKWRCRLGHEWEQQVYVRSKGHGCPVCAGKRIQVGFNDLGTTNPELKVIWSQRNPPIESFSKGQGKVVWWSCGRHEWEASIGNTVAGHRCPVCATFRAKAGVDDLATTHPELLSEWHPDNELTPNMVTAGSGRRIQWICALGHEWVAGIGDRKRGTGCPLCSNSTVQAGFNDLATTHPEIAEQAEEEALTKEVTFGSGRVMGWKCPKGHAWDASVYSRVAGSGCPRCSKSGTSKAEQEIGEMFEELGLEIVRNSRKLIAPKELDIYLPSKKTAIEYNGLYWHTEDRVGRNYHKEKFEACQAAGIRLITIWEDEWNRDPELVKRMLKEKIMGRKSIGARKTRVVDVPITQARKFLVTNHIQGFTAGTHYTGLEYEGELVAVMITKVYGDTARLERFAATVSVPGGMDKMMKYLGYNNWLTFADHCVSNGDLYERTGWHKAGELAPDYRYVADGVREHKFNYRLKRFRNDPDLLWSEDLSESQLARLNGIERIYDAGKTRYAKHAL